MSPFWSAIVGKLTPYIPGEQPKINDLIKLNTNENPYPPSPLVLSAINAELQNNAERLRLYPDPNADAFKEAVCRHFLPLQLNKAQIFAGNGSDEVLAFAFCALLKQQKPLLFPDITYSFYKTYCALYEINYETVALDTALKINLSDYEKACGAIILANPNAPTGSALALADIEKLLQKQSTIPIVIDEAYVDFGGQSAVCLVNKYPNLLVVRTLSKSHALAGLRVGFAIGNPALIEALERIKNSVNSYPLDRLAIVGGKAALDDLPYLTTTRQKVMDSREKLCKAMQNLGFTILESQANFIFAEHKSLKAVDIFTKLRAEKIIVRHFNAPRIDNFLRISIGTENECALLLAALAKIVE